MGSDRKGESMPGTFRHFAINADDVGRAKAFYERVFGWTFQPWGPPDFFNTPDAGDGVTAALQGRREIAPGVRITGFECTLGVDDLAATIAAIEAAGGKIVGGPFTIPTVGQLAWFQDPEGNIAGAMQYEAAPAV
jgi:predicted enzyme related to lactoylglutathione lyase